MRGEQWNGIAIAAAAAAAGTQKGIQSKSMKWASMIIALDSSTGIDGGIGTVTVTVTVTGTLEDIGTIP